MVGRRRSPRFQTLLLMLAVYTFFLGMLASSDYWKAKDGILTDVGSSPFRFHGTNALLTERPEAAAPSSGRKTLLPRDITRHEGLTHPYARKAKPENSRVETRVDFHPVGPGTAFFLYSAHLDHWPEGATVTIVAIVNRSEYSDAARVKCVYDQPFRVGQLQEDNVRSGNGGVVSGKVFILPDHHGLDFAPALVYCPLPNSSKDKRPIKVTLNLEGDNSTTSELHIQYPQPRRWKFLICFSPLHKQFNDANLVVHNLELAQILGAEHAVVYNTSISADVDKVLRYYVSTGFLEVKGWHDPPEPVHYKAQMGAINDCLLYGRNSSDFIVFMDFDEMIVPRHHGNWSEFIQDVQNNYNSLALAPSQKGSLIHMNDALVTALSTPRKVNATTRKVNATTLKVNATTRKVNATTLKVNATTRKINATTLKVNATTRKVNATTLKVNATTRKVNATTGATPRGLGSLGRSKGNNSTASARPGAYAFVSSVFLWDNVTNLSAGDLKLANQLHITFLLKQRRTVQTWPDRSKNIVDPRAVKIMGIHRVHTFVNHHITLLVNKTVALLHHYRWFSPGVPTVKDIGVLRFAPGLVRRIKNVEEKRKMPDPKKK